MSMTSAISEQFSKFVQFAEDQSARGKNRAIATKSDVAANGGNTLEERNIAVTSKIDWVSLSFLRSDGAKRVNNEVRDIFKKTVFDMFGGERNVPDSVKEAMLMKDYGCGKPLTARRIIAVRDAIVALNRVNCFDGEIDVGGQLAQRAIAAGYTRLDFGRLNTAANLLVEAKRGTEGELSYGDALEQVITKGSAANRTMNIGSLYMKSADDFRRGLEFHERIAAGDARNLEVARLGAGKDSVGSLSEIAENLEYKYENLLHDADEYLDALGMPRETLAELRQAITEVKGKFKTVKSELSSGALNGDREKAYERLFRVNLGGIHQAVEKIVRGLRDVAAQNPAIEEFRQYLAAHISQGGVVYDRLTRTYQEAVALDMTESAKARLVAAAHEGGVKNNSSGEIPAAILDNVDKFLAVAPFDRIKKLEKFCECLEQGGSANLRFTAEQKAELGAMVEQAFGKGPKADKVLARLVEQFEASFFAEQMLNPTDFVKNPPAGPASSSATSRPTRRRSTSSTPVSSSARRRRSRPPRTPSRTRWWPTSINASPCRMAQGCAASPPACFPRVCASTTSATSRSMAATSPMRSTAPSSRSSIRIATFPSARDMPSSSKRRLAPATRRCARWCRSSAAWPTGSAGRSTAWSTTATTASRAFPASRSRTLIRTASRSRPASVRRRRTTTSRSTAAATTRSLSRTSSRTASAPS